jgi:2-amino-4-hydroxy-6-hydroxymethyldihydropteridine diphosphokinase
MEQVIFGLGSNYGDREAHLAKAIEALRRSFSGIKLSPVYEAKALLPGGAPKEWDTPYWNMAVGAMTGDGPVPLLAIAKSIEQKGGRQERGRWAPREIDVDILAVGDMVLRSRTLVIPHRELIRRDFALVPLADVAPDWKFPVEGAWAGMTARKLVDDLGMGVELKKLDLRIA